MIYKKTTLKHYAKIMKEIKGAKRKEREDSIKWKEVKRIIKSSF